ncbi:unnamed protein product [marine sediment metagenome]|uniref:Uncharacterized protein n=1 Tax=marine sediment metagenome TaxID=412755 RepID=X0WRH2_9ZZZZ
MMYYYLAVAPVTIAQGQLIELTESQLKRRRRQVQPAEGDLGYVVMDGHQVQFKAGEEFGYAGKLGANVATMLTEEGTVVEHKAPEADKPVKVRKPAAKKGAVKKGRKRPAAKKGAAAKKAASNKTPPVPGLDGGDDF